MKILQLLAPVYLLSVCQYLFLLLLDAAVPPFQGGAQDLSEREMHELNGGNDFMRGFYTDAGKLR
jgi:hypothetical protein